MTLVIALAGLHGTGKSSQAKRLAKEFNLEYVSIGMIFRELARNKNMDLKTFSEYSETHPEIDEELDELIVQKAKKGNVIIDSQLAAWKSKNHADMKILLTAPLKIRVQRIADRDQTTYEEALSETLKREDSEKKRYLKLYGIDIDNKKIYDLILNTESLSIDEVYLKLKKELEKKLKDKSGE